MFLTDTDPELDATLAHLRMLTGTPGHHAEMAEHSDRAVRLLLDWPSPANLWAVYRCAADLPEPTRDHLMGLLRAFFPMSAELRWVETQMRQLADPAELHRVLGAVAIRRPPRSVRAHVPTQAIGMPVFDEPLDDAHERRASRAGAGTAVCLRRRG